MYLSKFDMNWEKVKNPYEIHRHLWRVFPQSPKKEQRFLFRVEWKKPRTPVQIIVQSILEPKRPEEDGVHLLGSKYVELKLKEGQLLRFALCANPTKRLNEARCRVPLIRDSEQIAWLSRKLIDGATLCEAQIIDSQTLHFRKQGQPGKIVTVTFSGLLRVKQPNIFIEHIKSGLGPAKSFGCGLISLARA